MGQETEERAVRSAEEASAQSVPADGAALPQADGAAAPQADGAAAPPAEGAAPPPAEGAAPPPAEGAAPPQGQPNTTADSVKKLARISSPEQVDDYIRVTTPGMWLLVVAILVLLTALIIWGAAGRVLVKDTDENGQVTTEYVAPASYVTDGVTGN